MKYIFPFVILIFASTSVADGIVKQLRDYSVKFPSFVCKTTGEFTICKKFDSHDAALKESKLEIDARIGNKRNKIDDNKYKEMVEQHALRLSTDIKNNLYTMITKSIDINNQLSYTYDELNNCCQIIVQIDDLRVVYDTELSFVAIERKDATIRNSDIFLFYHEVPLKQCIDDDFHTVEENNLYTLSVHVDGGNYNDNITPPADFNIYLNKDVSEHPVKVETKYYWNQNMIEYANFKHITDEIVMPHSSHYFQYRRNPDTKIMEKEFFATRNYEIEIKNDLSFSDLNISIPENIKIIDNINSKEFYVDTTFGSEPKLFDILKKCEIEIEAKT